MNCNIWFSYGRVPDTKYKLLTRVLSHLVGNSLW